MRVGILAVQGDFEAHGNVIKRLGYPFIYVTHPKHLSGIQGLILPGGESTTMLQFLLEDGFLEALQAFAKAKRALFGTCAGAILLAREVINPSQPSLNLLDVTIERNAYGRQLSSHIGLGDYLDKKNHLSMAFIRAPRIKKMGPDVKIFATYRGEPVGVMQDHFLMTTFHPELSEDTTIHQLFIDHCALSANECSKNSR